MSKFLIYEINTRVWLNTLSRKHGREVTLATIPDSVVKHLAGLHVDAIWLMGIWKRSPLGAAGALRYKHEYVGALPDVTDADVIGSAYAIADYAVAEESGGRAGLAVFRAQLQAHKLKLILDYVPNHVAMDHPWVTDYDGICVRGNESLWEAQPSDFFQSKQPDGKLVYTAHGRDPNFPPWNDTAQLNAWSPFMRQATIDTLKDMASQCDGVRCDMAMLMMNDIFQRTWGWRMAQQDIPRPDQEFWPDVIGAVRELRPDFIFMAEAYWDLEYQLQRQGFDYTYDKRLYDRVRDEQPTELKIHLSADKGFQAASVRFIENHDEPRAVETFKPEAKHKLAALVALTTPGAVLLHDGQFTGRRIKLPVQITREKDEPEDKGLHAFYVDLLHELRQPEYDGEWHMLEVQGDVLAYVWMTSESARLIIANLTSKQSEAIVHLGNSLASRMLVNVMTGETTMHAGSNLHVRFKPYQASIYRIDLHPETIERVSLWQSVRRAVQSGLRRIFGGGMRG